MGLQERQKPRTPTVSLVNRELTNGRKSFLILLGVHSKLRFKMFSSQQKEDGMSSSTMQCTFLDAMHTNSHLISHCV